MKSALSYMNLVRIGFGLALILLSGQSAFPAEGFALGLDGSTAYATGPDAPSLDLGTAEGGSFTLEAWFFVPDLNGEGLQTLIYKQNAYALFINFHTAAPDHMFFRLWSPGLPAPGYITLFPTAVDLSAGWHHAAAVFDNQAGAGSDTGTIYLDGTRIGSGTGLSFNPGIGNSASALYVGAYAGVNPFKGWIDEVRLSDVVRYSGASYSLPAGSFSVDPNTRALWHFNEPAGAVAFADGSGNGNTLSGLNGATTAAPPVGDTTLPTVQSIVRLSPPAQVTSATFVTWKVTFSESVNNISTDDFSLVDIADYITGESITAVSRSSGTTVDVTVSTGSSGNGDLRLDVLYPGATIMDDVGNALNTSFISGEVYSVSRAGIVSLVESLDAVSLSWTTGGHATWQGQGAVNHDGTDAGQSGLISHSQDSWVETSVIGPGALSFWWKVSSEAGWDYLEFYVDGVRQNGRISGTVDWQFQAFDIPSAAHALRWRYMKDGSVNAGADAGWVDDVSFTWSDGTPPTVLSIDRLDPSGQLTSTASVVWRVMFSEHVNSVSTADFTLADVSGAITGESIASVSGSSGASIDVTASTGSSGDGTLRLDLLVDTATITDSAGNSLNENYISGEVYSIDRTAPVAISLSPADGAVGVALDTDLVITFSEPVVKGAGNIVIKKSSDDSVVETIPVTSAQVTVAGDVATIDPASDLMNEIGYYVRIDSGALEDLAANDYSGISDNTTWNFNTAIAALLKVVNVSPSIAGGTLPAGTMSIRITFGEPVLGGDLAENYQLQSLGPDALLGTADDAIVSLSANYAETVVTLSFAALSASVYRLTVRGTITDRSGIPLDGDCDGIAGGNWVKDFVTAVTSASLFKPVPSFDTGLSSMSAVVRSDFDGDGRNDLAIGSSSAGSLAVVLGRADGTFSNPLMFETGGSGVLALAVGDFDGDGRADLAAGHNSGVAILLGEGDGAFGASVSYGNFARSIAVADYDGNSNLDLAVANSSNNTIGILLNNGDGSFHLGTPLAVTRGGWPRSVTAGDFNGDGAKDLAMITGSFADRMVRVWPGRDDGTFDAMVEYDTQGSELESPVVGDFNGDGLQDLAVAHGTSGSSGVSTSVAVMLGKTLGNLSPVINYPVGIPQAKSITIGDYNDDGRQDIAAATGYYRCVRLLLGLGNGTFAPSDEVFSPGGSADLLAAGDFDGDGLQDISVAINAVSGGTLTLLRVQKDAEFAIKGYGLGHTANEVVTGDFDKDGNSDLAITSDAGTIDVILGRSGGDFGPAVSYDSGGRWVNAIAVSDFNGDGREDLSVTLGGNPGSIGVLLGRDDGTFEPAMVSSLKGVQLESIVAVDFNGDGIQDLAVASGRSSGAVVEVLIGRGNGTFGPSVEYGLEVSYFSSIATVTAADFNGDGHPDLAAAPGQGEVRLLLGLGDGTFDGPVSYTNGLSQTWRVVAADVNGDDDQDLVFAGSHIGVMLGHGDGRFDATAMYNIGSGSSFLALDDMDADGHFDAAFAEGSKVGLMLGRGDGTFVYHDSYVPVGYDASSAATGDFDGDGRLDLAVTYGGSMLISIFMNVLSPELVILETVHGDPVAIHVASFMAGQLVQGPDNAFDGLHRLRVNGADYTPITESATDDAGRTVVTGTHNLAGLNVHREVTVPATGNKDFARTVDVFENPTGTAITTTVRIVGNLGSDSETTIFATSDGDTVIEIGDQWIGTDDGDGTGTPALIHYLHGPAGLQPTSVIRTGDNLEWTYQLTVPAGQTVRMAYFTILSQHRTDAISGANALVTRSGFGGEASAFLTPGELESVANFSFEQTAPRVVGRHVFYNRSAWDGNDPDANANDDNAIATDKVALLPGGVATLVNYTSYSRGLNGIMVDSFGFTGTPTVSDFGFRTGNNETPSSWGPGPSPSSITMRAGAGESGSDRVTLIWDDNDGEVTQGTHEAVAGKWLEVTLKATANTGLGLDDVFYFGNAIGEASNDPANARVSTADVILIRNNPKTLLDPAPLTFPYDINRDKRVSAQDTILARNNLTTFLNELKLINLGGGGDGPALTGFRPANEESLRPVPHPSAFAMGWAEGEAVLSFEGPPGSDYVVLACTSIKGEWVAVANRVFEVSPGRFQFRHLNAPDETCFYKIVAVAVETEAESAESSTH